MAWHLHAIITHCGVNERVFNGSEGENGDKYVKAAASGIGRRRQNRRRMAWRRA